MSSKTVLITGISRGIGKELALHFSKNGWNVCGCYKTNKPDYKLKNSLILQLNISSHTNAKKLVFEAAEKFGRIDCVINNAGITADKTILKMTDEMWQTVLASNLNGTFYMIKEAMAAMIKNRSGAIINIASISALKSYFGAANYSASKAGIIALTKTAAREAGRFGITVNAVLPGFHLTDMGKTAGNDYIEKVKLESVLNTTTDIKELAGFIFMLAGMKTVSGQIFNIDSRTI
ncbi:MAG: SDR family NAD(P)-dependent oxidoreductase [Endomicrobia bacterium]|nr:SDR family NAD(P)-dependent oxidoreductase [Endomicrobiia bacterium]